MLYWYTNMPLKGFPTEIWYEYDRTHQSVNIKALPAHQQHQAVDATVKWLGARKARQKLVAIDGQGAPIVVHHSDE